MTMSRQFLALALAGGLFTASHGGAIAADERSTTGWMPMTQLIERLEADGYRDIEKIERDDGRYEVRATNRQGARVKLYLHRQSGEVLDQRELRRWREARPAGSSASPLPAPAR